jgi:sporulation-control protein
MLKNFLASMGFGAAKINLQLDSQVVTMGERITGTITLVGGDAEQVTDGVDVSFHLSSRYSRGDNVHQVSETVTKIPITSERLIIGTGMRLEYPFTFSCPEGLPVSSGYTHYYFVTDLDIEGGIDAKDRDLIEVRPSGILKNFLSGFDSLGFSLYTEGYTGKYHHAMQIMQFRPTTWLRGEYDEIVFAYSTGHTGSQITGWFELDKKTHGLMGALADELDLDEKKGNYTFFAHDLSSTERAAETIRNFIIHHSKGLIG